MAISLWQGHLLQRPSRSRWAPADVIPLVAEFAQNSATFGAWCRWPCWADW